MDRRPSDKQDVVSAYNMDNYPDELKKKVTLVQHFRKYLEEDNKEDNNQVIFVIIEEFFNSDILD